MERGTGDGDATLSSELAADVGASPLEPQKERRAPGVRGASSARLAGISRLALAPGISRRKPKRARGHKNANPGPKKNRGAAF
jgi:hypothetical protein